MRHLRIWLDNLVAVCDSVLRQPTSGLHKMNLTLVLRRSKSVLKVPSGGSPQIDRLIGNLSEKADKVRNQIWDADFTFGDKYLEALRSMVGALRRDVFALIFEMSRPDQSMASRALAIPVATDDSQSAPEA